MFSRLHTDNGSWVLALTVSHISPLRCNEAGSPWSNAFGAWPSHRREKIAGWFDERRSRTPWREGHPAGGAYRLASLAFHGKRILAEAFDGESKSR